MSYQQGLLTLHRTYHLNGGFGGNDDVARENCFGGAAPNPALDHRDDRPREGLDLAHELAQWIVPAERIAMALGQLVDIVTGGKHLHARLSAEDHNPHFLL